MIRTIYSIFIRHAAALRGDARGNILMFVGLSIFVLVGGTGIAVDTGRAQLVQSKLSSALDSAGLAAGADVSTQDLTTEATKYFNANFPPGYMGSTVHDFSITADADNRVLTLTAQADVPTTFMRIFGKDQVTVRADAEVTRTSKGLELILVMDNTGSMSSSNKLVDMKSAATDMINILYGSNETMEDFWVGLVPFSQAVNIGSSRTSWIDTAYNSALRWGTTSWGGCVDARHSAGRDITDDPPSVELFKPYYWPCDSASNGSGGKINAWYGTNSNKDNCSTSGTVRYKSLSTSLGPNKNCTQQAVTPMTASKTTILSAISTMTAQGYTHINEGVAWGWRMLSPRWRGLWGGEMDTGSLPLDYNAPLMNKAMVILTDGDNTMNGNYEHTAYWYLRDGRLGTTTSNSVAETSLNTKTAALCDSLKANNVILYTIAFGTPGSAAESLMLGCASKPEYYFDSPDAATLQQAFRQIGDSLSNLRLSR